MLEAVRAGELAEQKAEYLRRVTPFWIIVVAQSLGGVTLVGANPYGATELNWTLAAVVWGVGAFWFALLARDWRKAQVEWVVR